MIEWTTAEPSIGTYWLSIAPEKRPSANGRTDFPAVVKCQVDMVSPFRLPITVSFPPTLHVKYDKGGDWLPLDQDWFNGAQWRRVDPDPADPFADKRPSSSRHNDLP